jgi:hypothetical protein
MFLFVFNDLRWDVLVLFGDVAGIVDHHCLIFFSYIHESSYFSILNLYVITVLKIKNKVHRAFQL